MSWTSDCFAALDKEKIFENSGHRTRFKELLDCYGSYPFFSRGLCKCMFLSAWDERHFCIMLETLMEMTLGKDKNTSEMREKGDLLAEEQKDAEYYVYQLSIAFLDDKPFVLDAPEDVSPDITYIICRAMHAAEIIDRVE